MYLTDLPIRYLFDRRIVLGMITHESTFNLAVLRVASISQEALSPCQSSLDRLVEAFRRDLQVSRPNFF
jgi:hypothetical protein